MRLIIARALPNWKHVNVIIITIIVTGHNFITVKIMSIITIAFIIFITMVITV